jgi:transposase InsO family protein
MTSLEQRQTFLALIDKACHDGARLAQACRQIGLCARTVQRWQRPDRRDGDHRIAGQRTVVWCPANQLSAVERQAALEMVSRDEFKDLPPSQIVPRLADQGKYVASESTLYRLLRHAGQMTHRRAERAPRKLSRPRALAAKQANQLYSWDITYLPTQLRGAFFYLYLFVDVFSRQIVGWQVFDCESAELASQLLLDICQRRTIAPGQLTVHSDNGSPMKGETMLAMMQRLGVAHSRSRPAVSN